jgi:hypothetical protein
MEISRDLPVGRAFPVALLVLLFAAPSLLAQAPSTPVRKPSPAPARAA